MEIADNITSIMDFGEKICGVKFDIKVYLKNKDINSPWFDAAEICQLISISPVVFKKFKSSVSSAYFYETYISEDGLMELLFTNSSPLCIAFRKFVKVIVKKLFANGSVSLEDVKTDAAVANEVAIVTKVVDAVTKDRDFLEELHNKQCDKIENLYDIISTLEHQKLDKDTLSQYKNDRGIEKYCISLEKQFLSSIFCWGCEWFNEENGLPEYNIYDVDEDDKIYMMLNHEKDNPGNARLMGVVYYSNFVHILKATNRCEKKSYVVASVSELRESARRNFMRK